MNSLDKQLPNCTKYWILCIKRHDLYYRDMNGISILLSDFDMMTIFSIATNIRLLCIKSNIQVILTDTETMYKDMYTCNVFRSNSCNTAGCLLCMYVLWTHSNSSTVAASKPTRIYSHRHITRVYERRCMRNNRPCNLSRPWSNFQWNIFNTVHIEYTWFGGRRRRCRCRRCCLYCLCCCYYYCYYYCCCLLLAAIVIVVVVAVVTVYMTRISWWR